MAKSDSSVKLPIHYSGRFKGSFAYLTIKDRLPVILVKVLDTLCQDKNSIGKLHNEASKEEVKTVIGRLSALKNEMITNKVIKPLTTDGSDVPLWNAYLDHLNSTNDFPAAWYDSSWLYVECYLYRRIRQAFELSTVLKDYDPFFKQKVESLLSHIDDVEKLGHSLLQTVSDLQLSNDLYSLFVSYLEIALWGNKCDLSIAAGQEEEKHFSYQVEDLKSKILVNDTEKVWNLLQEANKRSNEVHISIVLDNAGFELFGDLCMLHFFLSANLAKKISLYVKQIPWFVSDTLDKDIEYLLDTLKCSDKKILIDLSKQWCTYFKNETWKIENDLFWTLPHDYSEMLSADPKLYAKLSESDLIIFKGDLNYRKLTGDRQWDETTSFKTALNNFLPTSLVSLRTVKCDVIVGLSPGTTEMLNTVSENWKYNGEYAVIQCEIKEEK